MAKVFRMNIPPEYQPLLDKIIAYFDNLIYPTWATRFFHKTRSAKKRNREKTILPKVSEVWRSLTPQEKNAWKTAASYTGYNGYRLFTADFSYRKKNGLSLPGTPSNSHQLYGLKMSNPLNEDNVYIHFHLKDLVGPLKIKFFYKKIEHSPPQGKSFNLRALAFYFEGGLNIVDKKEWESPVGNLDWTSVSLLFGQNYRRYFHLVIEFSLKKYKADVFLDNFLVFDKNGLFYSDTFNKKSGKNWVYQPFYRKQGWAFYPKFDLPYYDVVYLDS